MTLWIIKVKYSRNDDKPKQSDEVSVHPSAAKFSILSLTYEDKRTKGGNHSLIFERADEI